ncbi:MAG TPA: hypothetical protein VL086_22735 [Candidatus Nitrosotalea sp.]|nr:hypothetical protein [Candidatus Nitrosotalea sp.]
MTAWARLIGIVGVAGAWWLSLATAFLWNRGDDVGRLPALLAASAVALIRGPVWGLSGLLSSTAGAAIAGLVGLAWYGLGSAILWGIPGSRPPAGERAVTEVAERTLLGAAAGSIGWFFLGVAALYRIPVAMVALVVGLALVGAALTRQRPDPREMLRAGGWATLALLATGQLLALVTSLAPPTAKDTLLYHFALPKAWIAAGRAIEVPYNIAGYYPLGVEMHAVWAMLLGAPLGLRAAEAAAGAVLFLFAPLLSMLVYGWARERGADCTWAVTAALMVAWIPTVYDVAASAYVDLALTAYTALAVRAFGRWWTTLETPHLLWIAVGVGGALSIKLSAAFVILPLALLGLLRGLGVGRSPAYGGPPPAVAAASIMGALSAGCALAAPWYVRNWIRTGSPLFPFYLHLWPAEAPGWDLERSRLYEALFSLYGDSATALDYVWAPLRLAVAAQPDQPPYYDGVLGIAFAFVLPLLAWALWTRRLDAELRLGLLVAGCLFVFWLFSSQQLRYLLPAVPALAVATAVGGPRLDEPAAPAMRGLVLAAAALGLPVMLAWFLMLDPMRVVLGGESRDEYLRRRLDYYPYYELVNRELPLDAKVWLIDMRRDTYHLNRPYFSDFIFEDYTLTRYVRGASRAGEIRDRMRAAGITHLLVRHDVLFDYRRSPIVDERRTREENVAKLQLMAAFFTEGTRLIKGDQKFWLIELPRPSG